MPTRHEANNRLPFFKQRHRQVYKNSFYLAMRNITARARLLAWNLADPRGAFSSEIETSNQISGTGANNSVYVKFDANIDTNDYGNDMEGHAVGPDIKPYSVKTLYLISY